jgi:MFS family permease
MPSDEKLIKHDIKEKYHELLELAGKSGKFQITLFVILTIVAFVSCLTLLAISLQKAKPEHSCFNRQEFEDGTDYDIYKNNKRYKVIHNEECVKEYCSKWEHFENEILTILVLDSHSLVNLNTELNMECKTEEYFDRYTQQVFMGRLVGSLFSSYISDRFGRWYSFNLLMYMLLASQLLYLFYKSAFVVLFNGLFATLCAPLWNLACMFATETMDRKLYSLAGGIYGAAYAGTGIFNIAIIYFFRNWNIILWIHLFLTIGCLYLGRIYITETPIYLLERKRYEELNQVLIKISVINNTDDMGKHKQLLTGIEEIQKEINLNKMGDDKLASTAGGFSIMHMFKSVFGPYIELFGNYNNVLTIIKTGLIYNSIIYTYYGQILYVEQLPGNTEFNLFMAFVGELISNIIAGVLMTMISDIKKLLIVVFAIISVICYGMLFFTDSVAILALVFVSAMFITIAFVVFMIYFTEIVDVKVKSTSLALMSNTSSIMIIMAPYLMKFFFNSAYFMFSCLSLASLFNLFILPKSSGKKNIEISH